MPLPELKPIKLRPPEIVKTFNLLEGTDIEKTVNNLIHAHPEFGKRFRIKELAAQQTWFELTPLIIKSSAPTKSMRHELELAKELGHVAIRPRYAVEGVFYNYEMIVPIPEDMLGIESEEKLLKEHVAVVDNAPDPDFRQDLLELKPIGIATRVCGHEGSWMVYSYSVKDDPSAVWSTPLVDAPYKDTQPFLATKGGEFVILEDDRYPQSTKELEDVKKRISNRANDVEGLELEKQKMIMVNMEWVIAHAVSTEAVCRNYNFERMEKIFGEIVPSLTIHEEELKGPDLINKMIEIMYEPTYRFDIENIRKYTIRPK